MHLFSSPNHWLRALLGLNPAMTVNIIQVISISAIMHSGILQESHIDGNKPKPFTYGDALLFFFFAF